MSNPYEAPRALSVEPESAKREDDLEVARLRKRLALCGVAIGFAFGAVVITLIPVIVSKPIDGNQVRDHAVAAVVALLLTIVGGFALFGRPWTMYVAAAASVGWLAWLTIHLPVDLPKDDMLGPDATIALYVAVAIPGFVALSFAAFGIATDRAMRRRGRLARPPA